MSKRRVEALRTRTGVGERGGRGITERCEQKVAPQLLPAVPALDGKTVNGDRNCTGQIASVRFITTPRRSRNRAPRETAATSALYSFEEARPIRRTSSLSSRHSP